MDLWGAKCDGDAEQRENDMHNRPLFGPDSQVLRTLKKGSDVN
jgi:hypothetical protein